jgi:hypothetical protein
MAGWMAFGRPLLWVLSQQDELSFCPLDLKVEIASRTSTSFEPFKWRGVELLCI